MTVTLNDLKALFGEPQHENNTYTYRFVASDGRDICILKGSYLKVCDEFGRIKTLNLSDHISSIRSEEGNIIAEDWDHNEEVYSPLYIANEARLLTLTDTNKVRLSDHVAKLWLCNTFSLYYDMDTSTMYSYNGKCYEEISEELLMAKLDNKIDEYGLDFEMSLVCKKNILGNVRSYASERFTYVSVSDEYDGNLVAFRNGILNLDTDALLPNTPDVFCNLYIDTDYDPDFKSDRMQEIIDGIIPDKVTQTFYFDAGGYSIFTPTITTALLVSIYGNGGTGKSTLGDLLGRVAGGVVGKNDKIVYPRNSVASAATPMSLVNSRFGYAKLKGKRINIASEADTNWNFANGSSIASILKSLSSGDMIDLEEKFKQSYTACNTAKLWFISNNRLNLDDHSEGTARRMFIIPCNHHHQCDISIKKFVQTSDDALKWAVNKFIEGYRRYMARGERFDTSEEMDDAANTFYDSMPLNSYLIEKYGCRPNNEIEVAKALDGMYVQDVFDDFSAYEVRGKYKNITNQRMFEEIMDRDYNLAVYEARPLIDGHRPRFKKFRYRFPDLLKIAKAKEEKVQVPTKCTLGERASSLECQQDVPEDMFTSEEIDMLLDSGLIYEYSINKYRKV